MGEGFTAELGGSGKRWGYPLRKTKGGGGQVTVYKLVETLVSHCASIFFLLLSHTDMSNSSKTGVLGAYSEYTQVMTLSFIMMEFVS